MDREADISTPTFSPRCTSTDVCRGDSREETVEDLQTRYGLTAKQATENQGKLGEVLTGQLGQAGPNCVQIGWQAGLAQTYVLTSERSDLVDSLDNKTLQCHLLTADTSTVARTVRAIYDYLAVRGSDRSTCKAIGEGDEQESAHQASRSTDYLDWETDHPVRDVVCTGRGAFCSVRDYELVDGMAGSIGEGLHAARNQQETLRQGCKTSKGGYTDANSKPVLGLIQVWVPTPEEGAPPVRKD